jgi:pyrimidine-specific ribonucleoside hydrolase
MTNIATLLVQIIPVLFRKSEKFLFVRPVLMTFSPGHGKLNVFDYNYEFGYKSMDIVLESIPLVFAGYEPSSFHIY